MTAGFTEVKRLLNETTVRCFLSLAKTLSFTETAKDMYMTQQSVSKYIAKLEEELGFKLFLRTHHSVSLTRAGEAYYDFFSEASSRFGTVTEEMRQYYHRLNNSFKFGFLEMLEISSGISYALKELREKHEGIHITGEKHPQFELIERFFARELDLIITYAEFAPKGSGIRKVKVLDTPLILLVSKEYPGADNARDISSFRNEPFIKAATSHETLTESRARARRQCRQLGFTPSDIIIAPNIESAYMATELGQGVFVSTLLSRISMQSDLTSYPIGQMEELQCFWHEDQENPLVAEFAAYLEHTYEKG